MKTLNLTLVIFAVVAALGVSGVAVAKTMKPAKNMCSTGHPIKSGGGITFTTSSKGRVCG